MVFSPSTSDVWWNVFGCDVSHDDAVNAHHLDIIIQPGPPEGNTASVITGSITVGPGQPIAAGFVLNSIREFRVPPRWRVLAFLHSPPVQDPGSRLTLRFAYEILERRFDV